MSITTSKISAQISQGLISECHKKLNTIGDITYKSVKNTDIQTRSFLRENSPARLKELARLNCYAAKKIKRELDNQYGKNNYVLIAMGRSISSIAELMKVLGVNTKIIPLSNLRHGDIESISPENLQVYKSYLSRIGLSKTELKKHKDKTYILMDYTFYGRSLEKAEDLLKREDMIGNAPNLIAMPVSKFLGDDYEQRGYRRLFEYCRFKNFSFVGKLSIEELKNVYKKCSPTKIKEYQNNITEGLRKLFWFNVFDSLKEHSYKDIKPKNELDALYRHYLSPKALRNFMQREIALLNKHTDTINKQ